MKRPKLRTVAVVVVLVGVASAIGFRKWAVNHVRTVTGHEPLGMPSCIDCHRGGGPAKYVAEKARPKPEDLAADPRGRLVYAATGAYRRVGVIDADSAVLLRWIAVPGDASGVAVSPTGELAVSLCDRRSVVLIDAKEDRVSAEIAVGVEPKGLAFAGNGATLFVANSGAGTVSVVDVAARAERLCVAVGRDPFRVAASPDGARVAVIGRMACIGRPADAPCSEVTLLDGATGRVERRVGLPSCHLAESVTFTADGARVLVPTLRVRNLLPITQVARGWVMSSALASIDPATGDVALMPLQSTNRMFPDPSGVAATPDGKSAFVASSGADQVARVDLAAARVREHEFRPTDLERFSFTREWMRERTDVRGMPGAVAVVGAGATARVAVAERLGDSVALLDAEGGALLARVALGPREDADAPRRGVGVFNSAQYAFQGAFSCRSCHPDGGTDGLTYDFEVDEIGRNVVLNRDLRGVKGSAPFKWNGGNATLQRQCGIRFATVLTRADPIAGEPLDDLVAYLESMPPPCPSAGPDAVQASATGTTAVERGRAFFFREATKKGAPIPAQNRCSTCHPPPHFSNFQRESVATGTAFDSATAYDVPHLTGVARKAPFLHDGRARTLEEIWTAPEVEDHHGQVTDLNKSELNDLVEFLRSL
jgi:YVTN family beta-propeller protein